MTTGRHDAASWRRQDFQVQYADRAPWASSDPEGAKDEGEGRLRAGGDGSVQGVRWVRGNGLKELPCGSASVGVPEVALVVGALLLTDGLLWQLGQTEVNVRRLRGRA